MRVAISRERQKTVNCEKELRYYYPRIVYLQAAGGVSAVWQRRNGRFVLNGQAGLLLFVQGFEHRFPRKFFNQVMKMTVEPLRINVDFYIVSCQRS